MQLRSTLLAPQAMKWITSCSTAIIGSTVIAFAQGQSIPIVNAGFENDVLNCAPGPACYDLSVPPGWTGQGATWKPSTGPGGEFPGGVPGGLNVASLGNANGPGVIIQDLGFAPLANTTYTLTVNVGQRADPCGSAASPSFFCLVNGYAVELLVGTTSVASDATLRPATGTFALDTVTYNSGSSPGNGHLIIRLSGPSGGGQAEFAQVALNATAYASNLPQPSITSGGIVPVDGTVNTIQPGEWVSIYGTNLASSTVTWTGNFPTSLGGTSVTINGQAAYLSYVSPTQINLQAPNSANGTSTGSVPVVVTTAGGSSASTVTLAQFAPSFLLLDSKHVAGIILRSNRSGAYSGGTYDILGPTGFSLGYPTIAAKAGDTIELFALGLGPTSPAVSAGQAFSGAAPTSSPVTLLVNNVGVPPTFAGLVSAGLYQINLTVPTGLGTGDVSLVALVATVGGAQTPPNVVISLQ
jgi:uncharacterized protein (TIGR03437 family)